MHVVSYISWHNSVFFLQVSRQPITSTVKSWHNNHAACLVAHQQWWVRFTPNVLKCGIAWQDIFWYSIVSRKFRGRAWCARSLRDVTHMQRLTYIWWKLTTSSQLTCVRKVNKSRCDLSFHMGQDLRTFIDTQMYLSCLDKAKSDTDTSCLSPISQQHMRCECLNLIEKSCLSLFYGLLL